MKTGFSECKINITPSLYKISEKVTKDINGDKTEVRKIQFAERVVRYFGDQSSEHNDWKQFIITVADDQAADLEEYLFKPKKYPIQQIIPDNHFKTQPTGECYNACVDIIESYDKNYNVPWNLWALATTKGTKNIYVHKECYELAVKALDGLLEDRTPVIVGIDWRDGTGNFDNGITDHWAVIVGRGNDEKGTYYTYFEVAQDKKNGVDLDNNKFYLTEQGYLEASNPTISRTGLKPIVTAIRYEPNKCACDRANFTKDTPPEECGDFYNHKKEPKGTLIKIR
jgi:hypothetical protein